MNQPMRIAVVGAGPAGMYAIKHLIDETNLSVEIDLYERLPTPWGLVRAGVAPDHPEKKLVTDRVFSYYMNRSKVRFLGNVEVGSDVSHAELNEWYDAVFYATGASGDTQMGIPGEELPGSWSAREFVAWYNGHPDYSSLTFDLNCERAVVVGNGNVALDVARILTMPVTELEKTDIADYALEVLLHSRIKEVVILGRRGHMQGAFHNPELEELGQHENVQVIVEAGDSSTDTETRMDSEDWETRRKVKTLEVLANKRVEGATKRIVFRFLSSPIELFGNGKVEQLRLVRNRLVPDGQGGFSAQPTAEESVLGAELVLRAIGYRGNPFPGLPFDEHRGVIENSGGRVTDKGEVLAGVYVTGWIKRGPKGIIGTNRKCAGEVVACLVEDARNDCLKPATKTASSVQEILKKRQPDLMELKNWLAIDRHELMSGKPLDRPRIKITDTETMLSVARTDAV